MTVRKLFRAAMAMVFCVGLAVFQLPAQAAAAPATALVTVPSVYGLGVAQAEARIRNAGLVPYIFGPYGTWIDYSVPNPGTRVQVGSSVGLHRQCASSWCS